MEMKRLLKTPLYFLMGGFMVASLAACSEEENGTPDDGGLSEQEKALKEVIADYVDCTIIPTYKGMADASIELHNA